MKKSLSLALTASVAVLALSAGTASAVDCPIKIGGLAPLSAPGTVVGGEAMRDAMLIAEEDINKAGGVLGCDVKIVIGDTEGLPEKAKALLYQTRELRDYAHRQWDSNDLRGRAVVEAHTKIRHILARVDTILGDARGAGRPVEAVEAVRSEIESIQHAMLEAL